MDQQTKHEIWVIALCTMAALPIVSLIGFTAVSGLVAI
jgi:hypothetical protein